MNFGKTPNETGDDSEMKRQIQSFAVEWNYWDCGAQTFPTNYMMKQEAGIFFHIPTLEGAETVRREKEALVCAQSVCFPLNSALTEEEQAKTTALCFLCGQPAATGTMCHAGASTWVYI